MSKKTIAGLTIAILVIAVGCTTGSSIFSDKEETPRNLSGEKPNFPKTGIRSKGRVVHILSGEQRGTGAVIGPFSILTVAHVVKNQSMVMVDVGRLDFEWKAARVVGHIKAKPEDIVMLHLLGNEKVDGDYFRLRSGYRSPRYVVTMRGMFDWQPGVITPGDSGSPVLNPSGDLIGLIHGHVIKSKAPVPALFTRVTWTSPRKKFIFRVVPKPPKAPLKPKKKK